MNRKAVLGIVLVLLLIGTLGLVLNVGWVWAGDTVYIRSDGSIDPPTAPISRQGDTYTFTNNITDTFFIERNNIVVDGAGFTLHGPGNGTILFSRTNVTIRNVKIVAHTMGIFLYNSSNIIIKGNNIRDNWIGIMLSESSNNTIYHNNLVNNTQHVSVAGIVSNRWDNGYPSGGNYWSNYNGTDFFSGPYQNETGSDGIGDIPHMIDGNNIDHYPLINPWIPGFTDESHMEVAYTGAPNTLDPAQAYDTASAEVVLNVYETLIFFDKEKTDRFQLRLATYWHISPDGLEYTFTIRQGVKFHNNATLTTQDVEYSFERLLVIEGDPAWMFYEAFFNVSESRDDQGNFTITGEQINNAITKTENTVTFHLIKPYPPMLQMLAQSWSSILSKEWGAQIGDWPSSWNNWTLYNRPYKTAIENQTTLPPGPRINAMCGTGPFMLNYYDVGVEWSLIKYDGYWGGWPAPGSKGFLQTVTVKIISDWETRKNMFLEGQLDHTQVPKANMYEVLGQPGIRSIYPLPLLHCFAMFFTFNISVTSPYLGVPGGLPSGTFNESGIPPDFFSNIDVRKGFAYAFNYSKLIEEVFLGEAIQPATPIVQGLPFYNPAQEKYSINLTKAAEHFAAAWSGQVWPSGFNFTIVYTQGNLPQQKASEIIKAIVESLNDKFHIQLQPLPWGSYVDSARNHKLPMFFVGWLADYADPHNMVDGFMYSQGFFPEWQLYSNETIDTLVLEGIGTMNETARRQIYYELQRLYHEDVPSVPLYQLIAHRFERDWVQGWYYNPSLGGANYFYVQWKESTPTSTTYSWPMFLHDPRHTGYTESPAPRTNQTAWNYTTGDWVLSSPAVAYGMVFVGSYDYKVYALDQYTGAYIWNYTTGYFVFSSPAVADGKVYVGSRDSKVYSLNASTGALIWQYTTGNEVYSSPAVSDSKVYVGSADGKVYCLNASTGALIWNYSTGGYVFSSPAVAYGMVFVGSFDYKVYALDQYTGAHVWNYTTGNQVASSPAVADGRVYVGSRNGKVYSLNASTGALVWQYNAGNWVDSSPAVAYGKVYVGSDNYKVYSLNASTGALIWNYTTDGIVFSSPAVTDGRVYVGSDDSYVYALNQSTGVLIWKHTTGSLVRSSPAVVDGMLFIGSYDNKLYAFGSIIRVPENYPTVQQAIDAASSGDTILIAPGLYFESIVINKSLTIIGRMGSAATFAGGGSGVAITVVDTTQVTITHVVVTNWDRGIFINNSYDVRIYNNVMFYMSDSGIALEGADAVNNLIQSNTIYANNIAINVTESSTTNTIYNNTISLNNIGINLVTGRNTIYANVISQNNVGIKLSNSNGNTIYWNSFISSVQVNIQTSSYANSWDNGYPTGGNYWSDYTGLDVNGDGIGDTPYIINGDNQDNYPLMNPIHEVTVTAITLYKTVVAQGYTLEINATVTNLGRFTETFELKLLANAALGAMQTNIVMGIGDAATITFLWNTTGFAKGNYTVIAQVTAVSSRTYLFDNQFVDGWVIVAMVGDITGTVQGVPDGKVNIRDVSMVARAFGSFPGHPKWQPNADINGDRKVNVRDISIVCRNYGKIDP